ncbi:MAG: hypothetical protein HWQ38_00830 [Nostoc sp. NMS7]|uniref:hypothetical protein n=1 Tax=Nostoc sp. NMS7 TaxID=2815391 RepID=UPI0025F5A749|nr:hypothetical protein [Nostoc sp. NMS7]MBN3945102.1 hypothetical protein [Nostoc sp. NMS7]
MGSGVRSAIAQRRRGNAAVVRQRSCQSSPPRPITALSIMSDGCARRRHRLLRRRGGGA